MESLCWQIAFESYEDEEILDLEGGAAKHTGPVLATNYPTYLRFLQNLSTKFTGTVSDPSLRPCFLALANSLPVEWAMVCEKRDGLRICSAYAELSDWRRACKDLATKYDAVFRRIFVTATTPALELKYRVPHVVEFRQQLEAFVWHVANDIELKEGLESHTWEELNKTAGLQHLSRNIVIREGRKGFFVSSIKDAADYSPQDATGRRYAIACKALQTIVVEGLHGPSPAPAPKKVVIDTDLDAAIKPVWPNRPNPTDLLIVGLVMEGDCKKPDKELPILPLMALECQVRDPWSDVCMLAFYGSDTAEKLVGWYKALAEEAEDVGK
jgi:hypothetical protein